MADVIGIEGPHAEQIVTDFETGFRQLHGSPLRVYELLNRGRWAAGELLKVPRWTVWVSGVADAEVDCTIHHNEYPRFVGRGFVNDLHPEQWRFKKAEMPCFPMDERTGFRQLVVSFVDHVPFDYEIEDLISEGLLHLERHIMKKSGVECG